VPTVSPALPSKPTATERASRASLARRQGRYEEVARLRAEGLSIRRIGILLRIERKTVRRWLRLGHAPLWRKPPRTSILAPYTDFLEQRWAAGCRNAAQLWRDLVAVGFDGRPTIVRAWARNHRKAEPADADPGTSLKPTWHPPTGRRLGRMLMTDTDTLLEADRLFIAEFFSEAPRLGEAIAVAKRLRQVLRRESRERLDDVLVAADGTLLAAFGSGLRHDIGAVQAALELPWTTSPVEGQINRIKLLKRTMYGRAGFELLRQRVLYAA
jgi:transposase